MQDKIPYMQSSSKLFPVALLSAELRGDLTEDIYRLKPGNSPDPSVELALTRLGQAGATETARIPVILLHGSFSNRRFWYSTKGIGLGAYLARAGFDVWLAEIRGHGLSPRNKRYRFNTVADYARYDLPAIADFVAEKSGQIPHWIGHSMGGITLAAAVGGKYLTAQQVSSLALFGSQVSRTYWPLKVPPLAWTGKALLKRFEVISGPRLERGPEDEPIGVGIEGLRWHGLFGRFGDQQSDWWAGLAEAQMPLLAVSARADKEDPAWACRKLFEQFGAAEKTFVLLGRQEGYSDDYGHIEMLVSKSAMAEVWPMVASWLHGQQLDVPVVQRQAV